GSFSFLQMTNSIAENGGSTVITVVRAGGGKDGVTVNFASTGGTAIASQDYVSTNGTLSFAAGELSKNLSVTVLDNSVATSNRAIGLVLSNPSGGATVRGSNAVLIIVED